MRPAGERSGREQVPMVLEPRTFTLPHMFAASVEVGTHFSLGSARVPPVFVPFIAVKM